MSERAPKVLGVLWLVGGLLITVQLLIVAIIAIHMDRAVTDLATMVREWRPRTDSLIAAARQREQLRDSLLASSNAATQLLLEIQCVPLVGERSTVPRAGRLKVVARCDSLLRVKP